MDVAVIGDTHIPSRATAIPAAFRERIETADHVVHTGDFDSEAALSDIRAMASRFTAVAGNTDPQVGLPAVATLDLEGVTFVVTHGTGSKHGYEERVATIAREEAGEDAVCLSGHTHRVHDDVVDGVRLLNPGSATGAAPAERPTMLTLDVSDGDLDVTRFEQ